MGNNGEYRDYDAIQAAFDRQYRKKKKANLIISALIAALGVSSFLYGLRLESIRTIFRWLTVDAALFTTISAILCIAVNLVEVLRNTELTRRWTYYMRLSSAVAESVVFVVVLFSQLPLFSEHLPVFDRYDSFAMHVLIPLLGVESFLINDPPIGKLKPSQRWQGTWYVSYYAVNIFTLIATGLLPPELIPYPFLNYRDNGWGVFFGAFAFVYGCGYLLSWGISEGNRKLSWIWFRDVARDGNARKEG